MSEALINVNESETTTTEPTTEGVLIMGQESSTATPTESTQFDWADKRFNKFRSEDGTIQYDRLGQSYSELEKKMSSYTPVESIDAYDFAATDVNPEEYTKFKEAAKDKKLSKEQFNFVMEQREQMLKEIADVLPSMEKTKQQLHQQWGDDYNGNFDNAVKAFTSIGQGLDPAITNHPDVMKLLARIGSEMKEDSIVGDNNKQVAKPTETEIRTAMKDGTYYTPEFQRKLGLMS